MYMPINDGIEISFDKWIVKMVDTDINLFSKVKYIYVLEFLSWMVNLRLFPIVRLLACINDRLMLGVAFFLL